MVNASYLGLSPFPSSTGWLLRGFGDFKYPNEIGPGVHDIHSPRVPSTEEMTRRLKKPPGWCLRKTSESTRIAA